MAGSSSAAASSKPSVDEATEAYERGSWDGSTVMEADIERLRHSRKIPLEIACRLPGDEIAPTPEDGEYVVFTAH